MFTGFRRSNRQLTGGQTGDRPAATSGATGIPGRSDRKINTGQTGGYASVRPADQSRSDRSSSISRVTFISAKSFGFWVYQPFTPPLVGLVLKIRSYKVIKIKTQDYVGNETKLKGV
jgi:hypothetical protein